jgi:hypothetical protein
MTDKPSRWDAYEDAVLRIEAPGGAIWVRRMPISHTAGEYPDPEGRTIYVITAHNPGGRLAPDAENAAAQARLAAELGRRGLTWWPAAGGDPSWSHVEASAAVVGIQAPDAIALGTQFGQEAIFALTPRYRQVLGCTEMQVASTGWTVEPEPDVAAAADERWLPAWVTAAAEKNEDARDADGSEPGADRLAELTMAPTLERPAGPVTSATAVETEDEDEDEGDVEEDEDDEGTYESVSICEENFLTGERATAYAPLLDRASRATGLLCTIRHEEDDEVIKLHGDGKGGVAIGGNTGIGKQETPITSALVHLAALGHSRNTSTLSTGAWDEELIACLVGPFTDGEFTIDGVEWRSGPGYVIPERPEDMESYTLDESLWSQDDDEDEEGGWYSPGSPYSVNWYLLRVGPTFLACQALDGAVASEDIYVLDVTTEQDARTKFKSMTAVEG